MTNPDIILNRLANQQITATKFTKPHEIVSWLTAMQAQEYGDSKWAIGLRLPGATDADVEQAFHDGLILRTHLLRPTWHFVTPGDIRWLLDLTASRVHAANAFMYRKLELNTKTFKQSNNVIVKALEGERFLTRQELNEVLEKKKITASALRLSYLMMYAELEGLICSGPRRGKQFTYALLDERVPATNKIKQDEALHLLASRYFASRGPATLHDFVWWSGLTVKDARQGIASLEKKFIHEEINGSIYIYLPDSTGNKTFATFLMPNYDEYGISYKNRKILFEGRINVGEKRDGNPVFNHMIIIDGKIGGTWNKMTGKNKMDIETAFFTTLNKAKQKEVESATRRYRSFFL